MTALVTRVDHDADALRVVWSDHSDPGLFHHIWLRDNCPCPQCRHPQTWERIVDTHSIELDVRPVQVAHDGASVSAVWSDGHSSTYDAGWLHRHRYGVTDAQTDLPPRVLWDSSLQAHLPQVEHDEIMVDDDALLLFVQQVWTHGVTFVRGAPTTVEALPLLAQRVGHLRETNFGADWHVVAMIQPNNVAYTSLGLQTHTDLPNVETPPGIQFLHCLVADAPGGDSTLVDGFFVAEQIRRDDPTAFQLLSSVPVPYRFHDEHHDLRWRAPVIGLDATGGLRDVRFHAALTEPLDIEPDLVLPMYRAMRSFDQWCRGPQARISLHLEPGDVMVFHNRRVLHGRTAFDASGGRRQLHGLYVDVDAWASKLRMLRSRRTVSELL